MQSQDDLTHITQQYYVPKQANSLATASMVLGIISVLTAIWGTIIFPFLFGSIGIILSVLSKGYENSYHTKALIGLIACIASLFLNIAILFGSIYMLFNVPQFRQEFNSVYEQMYGESFDDTLEQITGSQNGQ